MSLMADIRQAIKEDRLKDFQEEFFKEFGYAHLKDIMSGKVNEGTMKLKDQIKITGEE